MKSPKLKLFRVFADIPGQRWEMVGRAASLKNAMANASRGQCFPATGGYEVTLKDEKREIAVRALMDKRNREVDELTKACTAQVAALRIEYDRKIKKLR